MNGWKKAVTTAVVAASLTATAGAMAANDIFVKIGDIKGESADAKHKGEIDVMSWSWGVVQTGTQSGGSGGGAGKVQIHDITIVKHVDASSPALVQAGSDGSHIAVVNLVVRKVGGRQTEYLKIKLQDVVISSVLTSVKTDDTTEHVTLNFGKVEYEYTPMAPDGSVGGTPVKFGWDVRANRKL
jgi:type VI secretion system secreted protein Hcp